MDNRIKQIARANGLETICNKTYEELAELITALAKYQSGEATHYEDMRDDLEIHNEIRFNLIEEIADAKIMIKQLEYITNTLKAVKVEREFKIKRQMVRLGLNEQVSISNLPATLDEIEQLQAENEVMLAALDELSRLGNGTRLGNSEGNCIAQRALKAVARKLK